MDLMRLVVASVTGLLLVGGYLASLSAYFGGTAAEYSARIESAPVPMLSLVLFLAIVVLAFVPSKEVDPSEEEA
jgi:hypothetical protein